MPLNLDAIGTTSEPNERTWTSKDALLYAVGVGAGADPLRELAFTTENSHDVAQRVLPTFVVTLGPRNNGTMGRLGTFNPAMLLHAEQSIELSGALPAEGAVTVTGTVADILDKRSGALVVTETRATDPTSGQVVFTARSGAFIRGEGGFGRTGSSGPASEIPDRAPDHTISQTTLPQQALIYRLNGDRNPLHSDPAFAARAGFDRPILHGLCTYGFAGRALLQALCDGDPAHFRSMSARFTKPVFPGQTLTTEIWRTDDTSAVFRTRTDSGDVALDRGLATVR